MLTQLGVGDDEMKTSDYSNLLGENHASFTFSYSVCSSTFPGHRARHTMLSKLTQLGSRSVVSSRSHPCYPCHPWLNSLPELTTDYTDVTDSQSADSPTRRLTERRSADVSTQSTPPVINSTVTDLIPGEDLRPSPNRWMI